MKGLELSKQFYQDCFEEILKKDFNDILPYLCVGLVGQGSECLGLDDDVSLNHDFEPGFCIFIPSDESLIDRKTIFKLERAYAKLPLTYKGFKRLKVIPGDISRHGVIKIDDFYKSFIGSLDYIDTINIGYLDSFNLLCATNGEVFFDNYKEFTTIRNKLAKYPLNIKKKKLVSNLLMLAQSGNYNYLRMVEHGEIEASQFALIEYINHCLNILYLINDLYRPYYKWQIKYLRNHTKDHDVIDKLLRLLNKQFKDVDEAKKIIKVINDYIVKNITVTYNIKETNIETIAFAVNETISDINLKLLDINAMI